MKCNVHGHIIFNQEVKTMFIDQVTIHVKSGSGGNGKVAFRREKYVPMGGPAGGDGGRGADVIFKVDEGLATLMDFRYNRHFKAANGEDGMSKNKHGKDAEDLIIYVPPGTTILDSKTKNPLADLTEQYQEATVVRGGRGGRGNVRFTSSKNPAPHFAENGEPGSELELTLELKLIADVGLIGFPNVGKSTLLSVVSAAKPKIANYHFTTLAPNLGVVETADHRSFVMADLPGLIEGAHEGVGLGHQFLRHAERTRLLVHVIDMASTEGRDPYEDFMQINKELEQYDEQIIERDQIVVANKMDMPGAEENLQIFSEQVDLPIYPISAITKSGTRELLYAIADLLDQIPKTPLVYEDEDLSVVYKHEEEETFAISRADDGAYIVSGHEIEKLFQMTDFNQEEGAQRFARQIRRMGVDTALRDKGIRDGDIVRILDFEFEFMD